VTQTERIPASAAAQQAIGTTFETYFKKKIYFLCSILLAENIQFEKARKGA
jgi:hypothetical protein